MRNSWLMTVPSVLVMLACCSGKGAAGLSLVPPESPQGVQVVRSGEHEATLSWQDGGADVLGYNVFCRAASDAFYVAPENGDRPLPASQTAYTFSGLATGAAYDLGVQAVGSDGLSGISYAPRYTVEATYVPVQMTVDEEARTAVLSTLSSRGEPLVVTLSPCSNNRTVQISRVTIGDEVFDSYTDWVGPYNLRTVAPTSQTTAAWGFTGGWHASNGDGTGTPTARTCSFDTSRDGDRSATVTVVQAVEAANTKMGEDKRFVLDEQVEYRLTDTRLYVTVQTTAREDLTVYVYYGMQIAGGFSRSFTFVGEDGSQTTVSTSMDVSGTIREIIGHSAGGHEVEAHMDADGLGSFSLATPAYTALAQYYGAGSGKGYFMLIGDREASVRPYRFQAGSTLRWSGYYEFR